MIATVICLKKSIGGNSGSESTVIGGRSRTAETSFSAGELAPMSLSGSDPECGSEIGFRV